MIAEPLPSSTKPAKRGWYLCWLGISEKPVVLYWGARSKSWHYGATVMPVSHYMGPLPDNPAAEAAKHEEL